MGSDRLNRLILKFTFGLFICILFSITNSVNAVDGVVHTIDYDTYLEYNRTLTSDDELYFEFETGNDIPIDVYLVTDINYELYINYENFDYITNGTFRNATEGVAHLDITFNDHFYIIFDNTYTGLASPHQQTMVMLSSR